MPFLIIDLIPLALSFPLWEMGTRLPDSMFVVKFHWSDIKYSVLLLCLAHSRHSASSMSLEWDHLRSLKKNHKMNFMVFSLLGHKMKNRKFSSPYGRGITLNILILFNKKKGVLNAVGKTSPHGRKSQNTRYTLLHGMFLYHRCAHRCGHQQR